MDLRQRSPEPCPREAPGEAVGGGKADFCSAPGSLCRSLGAWRVGEKGRREGLHPGGSGMARSQITERGIKATRRAGPASALRPPPSIPITPHIHLHPRKLWGHHHSSLCQINLIKLMVLWFPIYVLQ